MADKTNANIGFEKQLWDAGIDIEAAILQKHEYNKTRPYRHGGKKC